MKAVAGLLLRGYHHTLVVGGACCNSWALRLLPQCCTLNAGHARRLRRCCSACLPPAQVGNVGVGKTMVLNSMLEALPPERSHMTINFSAQASSNSLQVRWWCCPACQRSAPVHRACPASSFPPRQRTATN